jgi:hypothetical protein
MSDPLCFLCVVSSFTGFGWLHDPLLEEVQVMLNAVTNKSANHTVIPWTTAVPGAATNWTSVEDTRRRRNPDVYKTGKKNPNQVSAAGTVGSVWSFLMCVDVGHEFATGL